MLGLFLFSFFSLGLNRSTSYAYYILLAFSSGLVMNNHARPKSDFLFLVFGSTRFRKIRLIENIIIQLPFFIVLTLKGSFMEAASLLVLSVIVAFYDFKVGFVRKIPTPFPNYAFEYLTGFRQSFWLFPLLVLVMLMAVVSENTGLALSVIIGVILLSAMWHSKPEPEYYVWIFSLKPSAFLFFKFRTALLCTGILLAPALLCFIVFFHAHLFMLTVTLLVGSVFLFTYQLAVYSAFPAEMNLPHAILLALVVAFPPSLLVVFPLFYLRSVKNLKPILK